MLVYIRVELRLTNLWGKEKVLVWGNILAYSKTTFFEIYSFGVNICSMICPLRAAAANSVPWQFGGCHIWKAVKGQKLVPWDFAVERSSQRNKELHAPGGQCAGDHQTDSPWACLSSPAQNSVHTTPLPPGPGLGKPISKKREMHHHRILRNLQLPLTLLISFFFYLNFNFRYPLHNTEVTFQVE